MYNWGVDIEKLSKNKGKFNLWKMEQSINFGLNNQKLEKKSLKSNLSKLKIDPLKKRYLKFLLSE